MKRRSIVFLSLVLSIVLFVPSVPALADNSIILYCTESIDGFFDGTYGNLEHDRQYYAAQMYPFSNTFSYNDYSYENLYESLPSGFLSGTSVLLSTRGGLHLADISSAIRGYTFNISSDVIIVVGEYNNNRQMYAYSLEPFSFDSYVCDTTGGSFSFTYASTTNANSISAGNFSGYYYAPLQGNNSVTDLYNAFYGFMFISDDIGVYSYNEARVNHSNNLPYYVAGDVLSNNNSEGYTNFHPDNLPFWNGNEIIEPSIDSVETNSNHLYLSNFDAGYCKPYHMEELYRAGGGYLYFTYDFDSWINSHSDDYQLQVITQLNVDGTATTYNSLWPLDLQGCLVLPFNRLASSYQWADENILFIEYEDESLFSNYNRGYVYAINYLKYVDPNTQKGIRSMGNGRTRSFVSSNGSTHRLIGDDPLEENYFSGNSNHNQFLMSVTVRMVDNVSGDVSGSFTKTFNLLNGVSTVSNNQIRDNTNPYEPSSDDLYFPVQDSGGGYGFGGNNQLVNFQFPSDIELFIDNGFKQFLSWYETSADTAYATNRFWSSMGIFEENPAIPLYRTYFGFLPEDFKTLIFSCAGIGIVGGAFCILRRRLH